MYLWTRYLRIIQAESCAEDIASGCSCISVLQGEHLNSEGSIHLS